MDTINRKIIYNLGTKKITFILGISESYIKTLSDIRLYLLNLRKDQEIRLFWIDEDKDEITIYTQNDYNIFWEHALHSKYCLHIAPADFNVEDSTTQTYKHSASNQTQMPPAGTDDFAIHTHIECDSCLMNPIVGFRYKCIQCPNYDLCQNCESKHIHAEHMMLRMPLYASKTVIDAYISGAYSGRKHAKRSKVTHPFTKRGSAVAIDDGNDDEAKNVGNGEQSSSANSKGRHGRKHHHRHNGMNFLFNLYEMMSDFAEGGGQSTANNEPANPSAEQAYGKAIRAAEIAAKVAHETASNSAIQFAGNMTTSATSCATSADGNGKEKVGGGQSTANNEPAKPSAEQAYEKAIRAAEIAAKVAHETVSNSAIQFASNMTTSATSCATSADGNGKEKVGVTKSSCNAPSEACNSGQASSSQSLESVAQYFDPQYIHTGIQILNNFSNMFSKMLEPIENTTPGDQKQNCSNSQKKAETATMSSVAANLNELGSERTSAEKKESIENIEENKESGKLNSGNNSLGSLSQIEITDFSSDSESEEHSESFVKLSHPLDQSSTTSSLVRQRSQSLDKSYIMNFAQLSESLKSHIEKETVETSTERADKATSTTTADTESLVTNTSSFSTASAIAAENRAVVVYHADLRINDAVQAMMSMGFSNEGNSLAQLLESVNGNISAALDLIVDQGGI